MNILEISETYIKDVSYKYFGLSTLCVITTTHDFTVFGESHVLNPEKYDSVIGMQSAYQNAFNKLIENVSFLIKHS